MSTYRDPGGKEGDVLDLLHSDVSHAVPDPQTVGASLPGVGLHLSPVSPIGGGCLLVQDQVQCETIIINLDTTLNIRSALIKRAEALSVTSLGEISAANMKLLTLGEKMERKKTREELIDEILATT